MKNEGIRFGTIREYCSCIDRVSICMHETLQYENYPFIRDVPASYDELYLYGFGIIESEFPDEDRIRLKRCIEIMLSKEPRDIREGAYEPGFPH